MLKKFLKEVVSIVVGKQAEDIIDMLDDKKHVNEFLIAKKLDITINQTRNILYKISDHGLISSIRKKDKRKGWYTYFWKIEVMKSLDFLRNLVLKNLEQINYQIKSRETKDFYVCLNCNIELSEENALLKDFTCNECGNVFTLKDNSKLLNELKREGSKLEKKLSLIDIEVEIERAKLDKKREREIKKDAKEKADKRKATAAKIKASKEKNKKSLEEAGVKAKTKVKKSPAKSSKKISKTVKKPSKKSKPKVLKKSPTAGKKPSKNTKDSKKKK